METRREAMRPGLSPPRKGEAEQTVATSLGFQDQARTDTADRTDGCGMEQAPRSDAKRLADVTAKLALQGFALYPLTDESLLVTRWNLTRTVPGIEAAERFLRTIGGAA